MTTLGEEKNWTKINLLLLVKQKVVQYKKKEVLYV